MMSEEQIPVTAPFNKKGNIAGTYSFQDEYGKYLLMTTISNPLGEYFFTPPAAIFYLLEL